MLFFFVVMTRDVASDGMCFCTLFIAPCYAQRGLFAVAGLTMFNTLPDNLRDPVVSTSTFGQSLKTHLFSAYQHVQRIRGVSRTALYKCTVLTLLTYFMLSQDVCPSVRPSICLFVTRRYSIETAIHIIKHYLTDVQPHHSNSMTLVQRGLQ